MHPDKSLHKRYEWLDQLFSKKFLSANPALALLFVGILPVIAMAGLAVILDRKKIIIKI